MADTGGLAAGLAAAAGAASGVAVVAQRLGLREVPSMETAAQIASAAYAAAGAGAPPSPAEAPPLLASHSGAVVLALSLWPLSFLVGSAFAQGSRQRVA